MKAKSRDRAIEMRPEYEFDYSKAVRGKYHRRILREGTNVVVLDPDLAKAFRDSASVNEALRSLLVVSETTRRLTRRPARGSPASRPAKKRRGPSGRRERKPHVLP
jgi:hypothetical protein